MCVECLSLSVCLFVCLFVQLKSSKMNDPKVFKVVIGNDLGYPRNGTVLGLKGQGHGQ